MNNFFKKNSKGELTTQQIVVLIILIASFAVLLLFLFKLNLGSESDSEICHNSVVLRGNSAIPINSVPLDCQRSYVCITEDGSCENMTKPEKIKVKTEDEVYEALANELTDCWWMFGEGKVNYVGKDFKNNLYCSICSQIIFDNSVGENIFKAETFDRKNLYEYMVNNKMQGSDKTYSLYLYDTNDLEIISSKRPFGEVSFDANFYTLMGITSKITNLGWIGVGAAAVGATALHFISAGTSTLVIGVLAASTAGGIGGHYIASVIQGESGNDFISPTFIIVNSDEFKNLNCHEVITKS
ncbi:MAG: hypothetical protein U9Q99_03370 [Nanoarchaeota archaeon]|nr:hypothetical protein [Nanoarchaeota archaeon]